MNKQEFLTQLREQLRSVPTADVQATVDYYAEMIDDRMEEGLSEQAAVAAVGTPEEIAKNILAETPATPQSPRKISWWVIVLVVLGAPIWLSLFIAVAAVIFSVLVALWSVVISLYAVAVSLGVAAIGCLLAGILALNLPGTVFVTLGAALVCAGLAIALFMLGNLVAKGMACLTKLCFQGVKRCFARKERSV